MKPMDSANDIFEKCCCLEELFNGDDNCHKSRHDIPL